MESKRRSGTADARADDETFPKRERDATGSRIELQIEISGAREINLTGLESSKEEARTVISRVVEAFFLSVAFPPRDVAVAVAAIIFLLAANRTPLQSRRCGYTPRERLIIVAGRTADLRHRSRRSSIEDLSRARRYGRRARMIDGANL